MPSAMDWSTYSDGPIGRQSEEASLYNVGGQTTEPETGSGSGEAWLQPMMVGRQAGRRRIIKKEVSRDLSILPVEEGGIASLAEKRLLAMTIRQDYSMFQFYVFVMEIKRSQLDT